MVCAVVVQPKALVTVTVYWPLARLEMLIAFQTLFKRLPKLALAATPHYKDSYHFHGLGELRVKF